MENPSLPQLHKLSGLMRRFAYSLLALGLIAPRLAAENFALFFDDAAQPSLAYGLEGSPQDLEWIAPESSHISTTTKKFGAGSLEVAEKFRIRPRIDDALAEALSKEIQKMSIVLWVRLPEGGTGETFVIARREGEESGRGLWSFLRHSEKLGLAFLVGPPEGELVSMGRKPPVEFPAAEWIHLAMVLDGQTVQFFIDGDLVEQRELRQTGIVPSLGKEGRGAPLQFLAGLPPGSYVDDFGYFGDTALGTEDLQTIYEKGLQAFLERETPP